MNIIYIRRCNVLVRFRFFPAWLRYTIPTELTVGAWCISQHFAISCAIVIGCCSVRCYICALHVQYCKALALHISRYFCDLSVNSASAVPSCLDMLHRSCALFGAAMLSSDSLATSAISCAISIDSTRKEDWTPRYDWLVSRCLLALCPARSVSIRAATININPCGTPEGQVSKILTNTKRSVRYRLQF